MPRRDGNEPMHQETGNAWKGKGMGCGRGCCHMSTDFSDIERLERKRQHLERQLEAVIMQLDANNEKADVVQKKQQ